MECLRAVAGFHRHIAAGDGRVRLVRLGLRSELHDLSAHRIDEEVHVILPVVGPAADNVAVGENASEPVVAHAHVRRFAEIVRFAVKKAEFRRENAHVLHFCNFLPRDLDRLRGTVDEPSGGKGAPGKHEHERRRDQHGAKRPLRAKGFSCIFFLHSRCDLHKNFVVDPAGRFHNIQRFHSNSSLMR